MVSRVASLSSRSSQNRMRVDADYHLASSLLVQCHKKPEACAIGSVLGQHALKQRLVLAVVNGTLEPKTRLANQLQHRPGLKVAKPCCRAAGESGAIARQHWLDCRVLRETLGLDRLLRHAWQFP